MLNVIDEINAAMNAKKAVIVSFSSYKESIEKEAAIHELVKAGAIEGITLRTQDSTTTTGGWVVIPSHEYFEKVVQIKTAYSNPSYHDGVLNIAGVKIVVQGPFQRALCETLIEKGPSTQYVDEIVEQWIENGDIRTSSASSAESSKILNRKPYDAARGINELIAKNRDLHLKTIFKSFHGQIAVEIS